jgi:hypothetical protein
LISFYSCQAFCRSDGGGAGGAHSVGDSGGFGRRCAAGGRHAHELTFDYVEQLWDNYANRPKFAFASLVEAREQSATATGGAVDADLAHFVEHMTHTPQHKAHGIVSLTGLFFLEISDEKNGSIFMSCCLRVCTCAGRSKFSDTFLFLLADHGPVSADPSVGDKSASRGNGDGENHPDEPTSLSASLSSDGGAAEHRLPAFFLIAPRTYLDAHLWIEPALRCALLLKEV